MVRAEVRFLGPSGLWQPGLALWDDAVFLDDAAEAFDVAHGSLMWGFAELYDSLGPTFALEAALKQDFPATFVGFSLVLYKGPAALGLVVQLRGRLSRRGRF